MRIPDAHFFDFSLGRRRFLQTLAFCTVWRANVAAKAATFEVFLQDLWPSAQAAGVSRETFDAAVAGLAPEPGVMAKPRAQAEFTISIPAYLAGTVTNGRVARGRAVASELAAPLRRAAARHGVPGEILVAILGVESNFGTASGGADVLRVLATLAWKGHRAETFIDEFVAALVMLEKGYATRAQLRGSWAGAMGQPQFMPSAYLKYAESDDGAGASDIWRSRADSIASIANFLAKSGWVAGLPAVIEIRLPQSFDYASFDLDFSRWRQLGATRADGEALPASGAASLYLPAGASGPAFLITDNFEVIRQYNTSDAYALSVALLAERIAGREIPLAPWPKVVPLSTADVKAMQQLLAQRGFYRGTFDGKLGRASRNALHAFQLNEGIQPADGFATKEALARLRGD
ncbi:lytic murein transglycosylase [Methylocystis sp. 9N]|uniref:Lytic murein transglycosylase n=1 Tax=Methylocystis borbori TaxID=3118750 RepID=A0ABU7XHC0_9HYPH